MAKSQNQKAKILYLERMMRETGENHVMTMQEILAGLTEYGICAERKSIYDDFEALRAFGMDVRFKRGKSGGYYLAGQVIEEAGNANEACVGEAVEVMQEACAAEAGDAMQEACAAETDDIMQEACAAGQEVFAAEDDYSGGEMSNIPGTNWSFGQVHAGNDSNEEEVQKLMKLSFSKEKDPEVRAYFGTLSEYKEKGEDMFTACVTYANDPKFFGWLTAMGKDVKILKPKKLAQSYRDYLKGIMKAYK